MRHLNLLGKSLSMGFTLLLLILTTFSFTANAQQKIVGGEDAEIKDYPWQVALTSSWGGGFCGGSIIGDSWVLTAAHCVNGESAGSLFIRVGASDAYAASGDSYSVSEIIIHPNYNGSTNQNDVALIHIDGAFAYNEFVGAIDLITTSEVNAGATDAGATATVTGWGTLSSGGSMPSVLQVVDVPVVSNATAMNPGGYGSGQITSDMICAGDMNDGGEDSCQGDSGGPLVVRNMADTDWMLAGVVSWGYGCAEANYPGVYARVSYLLDWIQSTADINSDYGCMDASACNYDAEAIYDDGSCAELDECGDCGGDGPDAGYDCDGNCVTGETLVISMSDSYGDGWNGNVLNINGQTLTIESGSEGSATICYDSNEACVLVSCDGGSWQSEVSWTISDTNGTVLLSGGAPYEGGIGDCGIPVPGCTDPAASNYNAQANEDDGSCEYPINCDGLTAVVIEVGGGSWGSEVSWTLGGFTGGEGSVEACLEDGCHTFNMADSYGDGWNGNVVTITSSNGDVLLTGTLEEGSEGALGFGLNTAEDCGGDVVIPGNCDGLTAVTIEVGGGSWGSEVSWTLGEFTGGEGSVEACLEDGCHTFNMADSYGDGWNGNVVTITTSNGDVVLTGTLEEGSEGVLGFGLNTEEDCGEITIDILGCTDPAASNYNELATQDDGSCEYPIDCTDATGFVLNMNDSFGDGWNGNIFEVISADGVSIASATIETGTEGTQEFCLNDGCYTVVVDGGSWQGEVSWELLNTDGGLVLSGGAPFNSPISMNADCGYVYGCMDSLATNYNAEATVEDGSCTYPVPGCMDAEALNYNPEATEDDGSCTYPIDCTGLTAVTVEVGGGSWSYEVSWTLGEFTGGEGLTEVCLEDGCQVFNMFDSYGDGWNGNTATITTSNGEVIFTATLDMGSEGVVGFGLNTQEFCGDPVPGCTDAEALNYNAEATEDDGSCVYPIDCTGGTTFVLSMMDSYGDGWNGNILEAISADGTTVATATLESGSEGSQEICLIDGCYTIVVDGGSWQSEVSWELFNTDSALVLSGGAPFSEPISMNADCGYVYGCMDSLATNYNPEANVEDGSCTYPVPGCMDVDALNYNPDATEDDGSCTYPIDCTGLTAVTIEVGGGFWEYEVSWELNGVEGVVGTTEACLEDGCYTFNMFDSYGDGWNGNIATISLADGTVILSTTLEAGFEGTIPFALNADCGFVSGCMDPLAINYNAEATIEDGSCIYPLPGCTDPEALNYNPDATEDDGSCTYPIDCTGLTAVMIEVGGGSWQSEVSWSLGAFEGLVGTTQACLEDGCHTFNMYDSYGDGWNGNTVTITSSNGDVLLSGTLEWGSEGSLGFGLNTEEDCGEITIDILGCTDPNAINYNPMATQDDGSCEYEGTACDAYTVMMNMNDSYGDGWNGNVYTITDASGTVVATGGLETGDNGTDELCLAAGCYSINVGGGSWTEEVSWSLSLLSDDIMEIITEGIADEEQTFSIFSDCEGGNDVYGCTDPEAINYNVDATIDDDSCEYSPSCDGLEASVVVTTAAWGSEISWSLVDLNGSIVASSMAGDYTNDTEYVTVLCLDADTDYTMVMEDSYGDGWNGGSFVITSADCDLASGTLETGALGEVVFNASCEGDVVSPDLPEEFDFPITGVNHTILIDMNSVLSIDGAELESGDAIAVFYTNDAGDLSCAGSIVWNNETNSIAAQGDDTTTDEIDGFQAGEAFTYMIWDASEDVILMATATYSNAMPNGGDFIGNGMSLVATLETVPPGPSEQTINFPVGWSMFSTYMVAADMNIDAILAPIFDVLVIAKNNAGLAYLPEWGFNGIGEAIVGQGYQVKTTEEASITVVGEYMFPEEHPIDLGAGWNMIGYLRTEPAATDAVMADIVAEENLVIVKNYQGLAYLPEWGFNGIGDMNAGQGYQLKVNNDDVLNYLSNDDSYRLAEMEIVENNVAHFSKVAPTDNNMTVVIEDAAWDVLPMEGSEVAAFDKAGNLIGSAIYSSPVTVLTVWGDDATTSSKDGLEVSEVVSFKVWTSGTVRDFTVAQWTEGSAAYTVDAINVASTIESNNVVTELNSSDRVLVRVINVLGQEVNSNDDTFKGEVLFNVYDDGTVEKFVN